MKILFVILIFFFSISCLSAFSDTEILSIKNNAKKIMNGNFDDRNMISVLENMARKHIISKTVLEEKFQGIPDKGKTVFVKLSGKINEYGKTSLILITIIKPDHTEETIQTPILETGKYTTYYPVDYTFSPGIYLVQAKFGDYVSDSYFYLGDKMVSSYVPSWIKTLFYWWLESKISDNEFVNSIQFLIDSQIIKIILFDTNTSDIEVTVKSEQMIRRGTTHTIITHVSDNDIPVEGAKVILRIEDYGEDLIREQDGFTNQNGDFIFSWEIPKSFDDIETLLAYVSVTNGESSVTQLFKFQVYCLPGESNCNVNGN